MEKNKVVKIVQKRGRAASRICVVFIALVCLFCSILPASAFVYSPTDSDMYSMPLDFVFSVETKEAGVMQYKLAGYLLSPLLGENISASGSHDTTYSTIDTSRNDMYDSFSNVYYPVAQSLTGDRLLSIYSFLVDDYDMYDYGKQRFTLYANPSVVSLGNEFVQLSTNPDTDTHYESVFVSFDYKVVGDTTVHHYEKGSNTVNFVDLIPQATQLGLTSGDLIYIYNYIAVVVYDGDPDLSGDQYNPRLSVSSITVNQKQINSALFMAENDRLIAENGGGGTPPVIDNVWLLNSVASFFNFEIFPGFSLGGVMGILFAITVLIAVLKFVAGG